MAKNVLKLDDTPAECILIRSYCPIYTLVYWLNRSLHFKFECIEDYELEHEGNASFFPCYEQFPEEDEYGVLEVILVSNWTELSNTSENFGIFGDFKERVYLFPEQKSADYICVIKEEISKAEIKKLVLDIMNLDVVDYAVHVEFDKLKSKKNLII